MNINIDGHNIYYEKYGSEKQNILILPGWGDTRPTFNNMINELKKKYTVYILDYPGFGKSSFEGKDLTIYDYAKLINRFMKKIKIKNPVIIAHSFGVRVAILLDTLEKTDFKKLIIIDGAGIKKKRNIKKILKQTCYKMLKKISIILPKKIMKKYLSKLLNIFGSKDYKALNNNMRKTFSNIVNEDLTDYIKDISKETLIIWGENDLDTPLKDGIKMNELIKDSGLVIITKGTHFAYLDAPFYVNRIILEFIK